MKKSLALLAVLFIGNTNIYADSGWYQTRKPVPIANANLEHKDSNIRDLITDCNERSISLSCHRAGMWLIKRGEEHGISYIKKACELGRGYSCRVVAENYLSGKFVAKNNDTAIKWFQKGCLRYDKKSCRKYYTTTPSPLPKPKTAFEKIQNVIGL